MKRITNNTLLEYSKNLPEITEYQKDYAIRHLPRMYFSYKKSNYVDGIPIDKIPEKGFRPYRAVKHGNVTESFHYTIVTTFKGIQVLRTFEVYKSVGINKSPEYSFHEVYQNWFYNGRRIVTGKKLLPMRNYKFDLSSENTLKRPSRRGYYGDIYRWCWIHLVSSLTPENKKKGLGIRTNVALEDMFKEIPFNNDKETMLKIGYLNRVTFKEDVLRQCVIAKRHNYKPRDWQMWIDHINTLKRMDMDICNPKYICPKNLKKEHNELLEKERRRDEKIRRKNEHKEDMEKLLHIQKDIDSYREFIKRYVDIMICSKDITISPLKSVEEFQQEGEAMHHCVFKNNYYNKRNILIFSAKKSGSRIATIEYSLTDGKVLQCRGYCNKKPKEYDLLINIMTNSKTYERISRTA